MGNYVTKNGGGFEKDEHGKKIVKESGVVVGRNPYNNELMLHDGPEHVLLMAPARSGKGVNTVIPTGLTWRDSIFFFDPKGELWDTSSGYRKNVLKQKVMKFEPICSDGSTNRWNPLAEINFRTEEEMSDVSNIVLAMIQPDGLEAGTKDPFLINNARSLLSCVIMHLMYKYYREKLPLPSPKDILSTLSYLEKAPNELFGDMMTYQHITPEEFLERELPNPLRAIYGEYYAKDLKKINDVLSNLVTKALKRKKDEDRERLFQLYPDRITKKKSAYVFKSMARTISEIRDNIRWAIDVVGVEDDNALTEMNPSKICWAVRDDEDMPFHRLLTHPRVAEQAAVMRNGAEQTRASIMQTAQTALGIYGDPVVQGNMCVSDFCIRDLLDPRQEISCYLVMQVKDIATVKPIARLFINTILNKLIRDMKFEKDTGKKKAKKQRLLLMLDEFPQLGNMQAVELALAICAGYGIKMCIVCQDVNQLNKEYTKDNSIASNCHVHIYFTPNLDTGGATAEAISKTLGKRTIKSISHSDGGGIGKGSNSISSQARDLMTPDEVARMSTEEEIVFVAGHKPIKGGKLRYYLEPWFINRVNDNPPPKLSDQVTRIETYGELFKMHEADTLERKKKVEEIAEAKRKRAEEERQANEKAPVPMPAEEAPEAPAPEDETIQEAGTGIPQDEAPKEQPAKEVPHEGEKEKEPASQPVPGEENNRGKEPLHPKGNQEAPAEGPRGEDEKPLTGRHRRRIPHDKRMGSRYPRETEDGTNDSVDREAIESLELELRNVYSAFLSCDMGDPEECNKAFALANQYKRLSKKLLEQPVSDQFKKTIQRHEESIKNKLEMVKDWGKPSEPVRPAAPPPLEYKKPEREEEDPATASMLKAIEAKDKEDGGEDGQGSETEDISAQIGDGVVLFNQVMLPEANGEGENNGTSQ